MDFSIQKLILCLMILISIRDVDGSDIPRYSYYVCGSTQVLNASKPAVKLFFSYTRILMSGHAFGTMMCPSYIISDPGYQIAVRVRRPYCAITICECQSRVHITDAYSLQTSFCVEDAPRADVTSYFNSINITATYSGYPNTVVAVIYQFHRGECGVYETWCQSSGICIDNTLFNDDTYDFCNIQGITTTHRPSVDSSIYDSRSGIDSTTIFVIIGPIIGLIVLCVCMCAFLGHKNPGQSTGNEASTETAPTNTASPQEIYTIDATDCSINQGNGVLNTSAPPDYEVLTDINTDTPPSYADVLAKGDDYNITGL